MRIRKFHKWSITFDFLKFCSATLSKDKLRFLECALISKSIGREDNDGRTHEQLHNSFLSNRLCACLHVLWLPPRNYEMPFAGSTITYHSRQSSLDLRISNTRRAINIITHNREAIISLHVEWISHARHFFPSNITKIISRFKRKNYVNWQNTKKRWETIWINIWEYFNGSKYQ